MSSSRSREEIAEGTGESAERVRSIFPLLFRKSRSRFGVSDGPRPLTVSQF